MAKANFDHKQTWSVFSLYEKFKNTVIVKPDCTDFYCALVRFYVRTKTFMFFLRYWKYTIYGHLHFLNAFLSYFVIFAHKFNIYSKRLSFYTYESGQKRTVRFWRIFTLIFKANQHRLAF